MPLSTAPARALAESGLLAPSWTPAMARSRARSSRLEVGVGCPFTGLQIRCFFPCCLTVLHDCLALAADAETVEERTGWMRRPSMRMMSRGNRDRRAVGDMDDLLSVMAYIPCHHSDR